MSYFSLVSVEARGAGRTTLRECSVQGEAYRDHRLIWKLFPGDERARDFIFRLCRNAPQIPDSSLQLSYYVVSQRQPQPVQDLLRVQTKPYDPQLSKGDAIRFDLKANPVVSRKKAETSSVSLGVKRGSERHDVIMDSKARSKKVGLTSEEAHQAAEAAAVAWLLSRSEGWGLQIRPESVLTGSYTQHRLWHRKGHIEFSSLEYSGAAEIVDPVAFSKVLVEGIGHGRAFGCGLLLARRLE